MYPASSRFFDSLNASHQVCHRVRVYSTPRRFGANPPDSVELEVISGSVKMTADSDVKSTCELEVTPEAYPYVQPYGNEIFVERGIEYGDRTREYVPLGWFRINEADQPDAPNGPIKLTCTDRTSWMIDNRTLMPFAFSANTTHRQAFQRLVNGNGGGGHSTLGYGMFLFTPVPITWTAYNPDTTRLPAGNLLCEDSGYEFLAKIAAEAGGRMRFTDLGELLVEPIDPPPSAPVWTIGVGLNGTRISRKVSREGVYNIVSAYGTAPESQTGYRFAYNEDPASPLWWQSKFGVVPRYYASPLLTTASAARAAARTVLSRSRDIQAWVTVEAVPNPALRPLDPIQVGEETSLRVDEVEIPIVGEAPMRVACIPLNGVASGEDGT